MAYVGELPPPPKCVECHNRKKATHQVFDRFNQPVSAPRCKKHAEKLQAAIQAMETKVYPRHSS